jgi:Xaa-Pro aminopeptidase
MDQQIKLQKVQKRLQDLNLDGWLLYDFRKTNDLACRFLEIPKEKFLSRRFFYWIPKEGTPVKIVHQIEDDALNHLPGIVQRYRTWNELENHLDQVLRNQKRICMEYSPRNAIPYISKVDAGTMDVVRGFGVEVASSGDLLQEYTNVWTDEQLRSHTAAADVLDKAVASAWELIWDSLRFDRQITEYEVQQYILEEIANNGCLAQDPPICAVNAHSANPHYVPQAMTAARIKKGDFILIDLWCKQDLPNAVYADITRVGVAASKPSEKQQEIFEIVKRARDEATQFVKDRFAAGKPPMGFEVDDVARNVIVAAGYGEFFVHRTGHNINEEDHGPGTHIDNFETQDRRRILPGTCFSIEPGIYLPDAFGVRLEYDVFVDREGKVAVYGGIQDEIVVYK